MISSTSSSSLSTDASIGGQPSLSEYCDEYVKSDESTLDLFSAACSVNLFSSDNCDFRENEGPKQTLDFCGGGVEMDVILLLFRMSSFPKSCDARNCGQSLAMLCRNPSTISSSGWMDLDGKLSLETVLIGSVGSEDKAFSGTVKPGEIRLQLGRLPSFAGGDK